MPTATPFLSYLLAFASVTLFVVVGLRLFGKSWIAYERKYLEQTGKSLESLYLTITPQQILYLSFLSFFAGTVVFSLLCLSVIAGLLLGAPCFGVPYGILFLLRRIRARRFSRQLVDALACINSALEAGGSLPGAFEALYKESTNPMRCETGIVLQELKLGVSVKKALTNLLSRMPSENLDLMVTAMIVGESVGGGLVRILRSMESTIRERHRLEGKLDALTAEGKMQAFILGSAPVILGVLIAMVNPDLIRPLYTTPIGWLMIGASVVTLSLGFFWMRRIVSIDL